MLKNLMMRYLFILFLVISLNSFASDTTKLYNPAANVKKDVAAALVQAKKEGKHVLIQVGGNWCIWCYRFHDFVEKDSSLTRILHENYVVYHLNWSKENKNLDYLKTVGFPQRFGFPVFVILDANGKQLHIQDSSLLEKEKSYDANKVKGFFTAWSPAALDEKNYKE
ncbi:MAG: thioredoxin family protein [Bacteroidota bacterium]|nr:thioredoxin family protein [Bacteroidota bacterium]